MLRIKKLISFSKLLVLTLVTEKLAHATNNLKFLENIEILDYDNNSYIDGYIESFDKIKLHYIAFLAENSTQSLLFYHGGGANVSAGYLKFAESISKQYKINVYLFDIRGHGKSEGNRGDAPTVESAWEDISTAIEFIKTRHSGKIILGGHSSGAGLVLNYMNWKKKKIIDKIILIAPQFGHTVDTKNENSNEPDFAKVNVLKIIFNRLSGGYILGHSPAVFFNYSREMAKKHDLVSAYSVNMALAVTPNDAEKQILRINKDTLVIFANNDELLDALKLEIFLANVCNKNHKIRIKRLQEGGHLTCLAYVTDYLGDFV